MATAAQDKKKKQDPKKIEKKDKKQEIQEKKGANVAGAAARIVDKAMSKGYADQKAALKPKDKGAAAALGPKTEDKKKVGVGEAAERAASDHKPGDSKQDHPLEEAKKQLKKAEKKGEKKAAEKVDPKKKSKDKTPPVESKVDKERDKKELAKAGVAAASLDKDEDEQKPTEGEEHEAAKVAAVAKDKAHGKEDKSHTQKLKGAQGSKEDKDERQEGHGSPEEKLAAEMIAAAKEKQDKKKGRDKKPTLDVNADVNQKKKWWGNAGHEPQDTPAS